MYLPQFLTLIFTIEGISFVVLSTYAFLASWSAIYLAKEKSMSFFNKLTGVAFAGFGAALLRD
jgi:threonine/homoserine/homoserine lactone efflux protein